MARILFVCTGNTCRSPLALVIAQHLAPDLDFGSAGLNTLPGLPASEGALESARRLGLDLSSHRSRPFTEELAGADLILTMTLAHRSQVLSRFPETRGRVARLADYAHDPQEALLAGGALEADVSDPYGGSQAEYDACALELRRLLEQARGHLCNHRSL